MRFVRYLAPALVLLPLVGFAQAVPPKPELLLFHPSGPPLSYEVATINPIDPDLAGRITRLPPGMAARPISPFSIRRYIMDAYGARYATQIVGGPAWLDKDAYDVKGKVPDELQAAAQTMKRDDQINQNRSMQQALLAERFHLKAHFETRLLPVYELVTAKGGLKITEVPAPPERKPGDPPPPPSPDKKLAPGSMTTRVNAEGQRVLNARAVQMQLLARVVGGETGDRPMVDHTGFTGYFDISDLTWAPLGDASAATTSDASSLDVALQQSLGIKLAAAKDPVQVLVIDSIERPSEN